MQQELSQDSNIKVKLMRLGKTHIRNDPLFLISIYQVHKVISMVKL